MIVGRVKNECVDQLDMYITVTVEFVRVPVRSVVAIRFGTGLMVSDELKRSAMFNGILTSNTVVRSTRTHP